MVQARSVCGVDRVCYLTSEVELLCRRERPACEPLCQRLPFPQLDHQEVDLALAPHVVEGADVRMIEVGDGARFALEPGAHLGAAGEARREHLDRYLAA